jgi:DNA repair photolyase
MNMIATVENIDRSTTAALVTRAHTTKIATGIEPSKEFEKKGLARYAVNVGTKCGHGCTYCSTGAVLRMHDSFKVAGEKR